MQRRAQRVTGLGTTIFAEMSELARRTGSVNLGQGFPDVDGPAEILEQAVTAVRTGQNQYAPGRGVSELRVAIADHQRRHYRLELDPDSEVLVTTGATEAIAAALLGLIDAGDEVVVLEPYYDSYVACIQMAGGVRRPVTLRAPDFRLNTDELRGAVTPRTRMLLVNSPHNPTGTVLEPAELAAIAAVAVEHDLVVVTDEVYEHLTFDDRTHVPLATLPGMSERTLTCSSAGKTFSVTGWKIGWVCGPADLIASVLTAKQFLTFTSGAPLQPAIAYALQLPGSVLDDLRDGLERKRDLLCDGLSEIGFGVHVPEGTYFATTDVRPIGYDDGLKFCRELPTRARVVAIPHQVFYDDLAAGRPLVRWAFCKRDDVLLEGLGRLERAFA